MTQQKPHIYDFYERAKQIIERQEAEIKFLVAEVNRLNKENAELKEQVNQGSRPYSYSSEIDTEYTVGDDGQ